MLNKCVFMGRMTRDPELRSTGSGKSVTSFTIACERDMKDKDGSRATDFIDCVAWGPTAEFAAKYFGKGRMAIIDGRIQVRDWTDKDGKKRKAVEVLADHVYFGESKPKDEYAAPAYTAQGNGFQEIEDEEPGNLPF